MVKIVFILLLPLLLYYAYKSLKNSGYALAIVWSTYATEQFLQQANPFFVRYGFLINVSVVLIAIASVLNGLRSRKIKRLRLSKPHLWYIALMGLVILSAAWSIDSSLTLFHLQGGAPYLIAFCVVAPYCAHDSAQVNKAINATVFLGGVVLFGMLFCNFGVRSIIISNARGEELGGNPLAVATYGGYVLVCCGFSFYSGNKNFLAKMMKIAIGAIAVYAIVRSGSRGQLFASLISCLIWIPYTAQVAVKRSSVIAIGICCLFALVAGYFISGEETLINRWKSDRMQRDQIGRFELAGRVIEEAYDKGPLVWMVGLGSSASYKVIGFYPHFVPGEVLAEEGIIGLIFFMGFLISVLLLGIRAMKLSNLELTSRINSGALLSMFTFHCLLCLKQGSLLGSPALFSIGLCIALSAERALATSRNKYRMIRSVMPSSSQFNARGL